MTKNIENIKENTDFFDTNQITFFGEKIKIGLLWGKYPRQLSLIGDRIISNYIKNYHINDVAFTNKTTVNYRYSKIPKKRLIILKFGMREIIINTNQSLKVWF